LLLCPVVTQETNFGVDSKDRSLNRVWLFVLLTARDIHLFTNQRKENRHHFVPEVIVEFTNCKQVSRKCMITIQFQGELLKLETLVTLYLKI